MKSQGFKQHPIQLVNLGIRELFIHANVPPDATITTELDAFTITVSTPGYDPKAKQIAVFVKLELGTDAKESTPYSMRIELAGFFEVDETRFPVQHLSDWARRGAPFILYPYLREHAFGLSSRCGFKPLLLPLIEVPVDKNKKPTTKTKRSTP